jgi:hypothetical protein
MLDAPPPYSDSGNDAPIAAVFHFSIKRPNQFNTGSEEATALLAHRM